MVGVGIVFVFIVILRLVVICDLHTVEVAVFLFKADPVFFIDPNAVLPLAITMQSFEMIRRRYPQIIQFLRIIDHHQFAQSDMLELLRQGFGVLLPVDQFGFFVAKGLYHVSIIHATRVYVKTKKSFRTCTFVRIAH